MKTAFNINLDSLGTKTFSLMDRFICLADKYGFKYTIFVCGQDIKEREPYMAVRRWSLAGHEIANHSHTHPFDFGRYGFRDTEKEVMTAHKRLSDCAMKPTVGFTSPCWTPPPYLFYILEREGYKYDASIMPSPLLIPIHIKTRITNGFDIPLQFRNSFSPREPYRIGKLTELPLPTTSKRIPCWHTMRFALGEKFKGIVRASYGDKFYYLMHPADLMDSEDFPGLKIERIAIPYKEKLAILEDMIQFILSSTDETTTMEGLCE